MFFDASDYGWAAVLCQRLEAHGAPTMLSIIAKGFDPVMLRWSAMERELYARWQGVVGFEKHIKGFLTLCYMDHKNNMFKESALENRRIRKTLTNWALELQQFNIVRIRIRGEANILADAPSRAPLEIALAKHAPVPNDPVHHIIEQMYTEPEAFEAKVRERANNLEPV